MITSMRTFTLALASAVGVLTGPSPALSQALPGPERLTPVPVTVDSLVAEALRVNPMVRAASEHAQAVRAQVRPARTLPDPMLSLGIMNLPVTAPGFDDFMTMNTVAIGQAVPFPGKLSLAGQVAEMDVRAAEAQLQATRLDVAAEVQRAYYEIAFFDRSLAVLEHSQQLLANLIQVTESRYGVGRGSQQDVLKARTDAARVAEEANALTEARRAALAGLNALLDRPSGAPMEGADIPARIARAAVTTSPERIRFTSDALGARAADSPLPPLDALQGQALERNPSLRAHEAEIDAQAARLELAGKAHLPDFDLSVQYGQRVNAADLVSVMVSMPIPVHRAARQSQWVAEARADLAVLEAGHHAMVNELRAEIARRYAEVERDRTQLALFVTSIVPLARASLESATAAFEGGQADFMTLLDGQATLYEYEIAYHRALTEFAKGIAELERVVGMEVLP